MLIYSTKIILKFFNKLLGTKITVTGEENIPDSKVLFVANHFTRFETLILPYVIHKHKDRVVRSLADKALFQGAIGKYLEKFGVIPTNLPNRDKIIIGDLLTSKSDWLIYPEGNMMKNKKVTKRFGKYYLSLADQNRKMFTGAAVMALKTEILRHKYFHKIRYSDNLVQDQFKKEYFIENDLTTICTTPLKIIPVNISYYPFRSEQSRLFSTLNNLLSIKGERFHEEILIDSFLLSQSEIYINIGKPIEVEDWIVKTLVSMNAHSIDYGKFDNLILKLYRNQMTTHFTSVIYNLITINFDHIFANCLFYYKNDIISDHNLRKILYIVFIALKKKGSYSFEQSMLSQFIYLLLNEEEQHEHFESILKIAILENIIKSKCDINTGETYYHINRNIFQDEHDFHNIRLKNKLKILVNECETLSDFKKIVKSNVNLSCKEIREKIKQDVLYEDKDLFLQDHKEFFSKSESKPIKVGCPVFHDGKDKEIGILVVHGYKSSPGELSNFAKYLHAKLGVCVYQVRLRGHGTAPINLKYTKWQDWYDSVSRGKAILKSQGCKKIVLAGFSTGGLLSLLSTSLKTKEVDLVISINSALRLQDIRVRFVPTVKLWNELLKYFDNKLINVTKEFVQDKPENPELNYDKIYLNGVYELNKLMKETKKHLSKIIAPVLIIQASKDPVVNPESGMMIYNKISSATKEIIEPDLDYHTIMTSNENDYLYDIIVKFIQKSLLKGN